MLNQEQTQILEQAIILLFRLRNEQSIDNWERERARQFEELHRPIINLKEIDSTENINDENGGTPLSDKDFKGFLNFTEKEILKMPKPFRKIFRVDGNKAHVRKRADGRYKCSFEIRYAKKPYNKHPISASGATLEIAKARFIEKLNNYVPQDDTAPTVPKDFHEFAMYWLEKIHKRKVKEKTYDHDIKLYNRHIKERFAKFKVKDVHMAIIQDLLDNAPGKGKTAKDLHSILKQILDCAVKHGLIKLNPIGMCFLDDYEQKHGVAISFEEERKLDNAYKGTEWEIPFAVARYTGLRPCEYLSAAIEGNFIKAQNGKRKDGKVEFKYIPITPMLKPYLQNVIELNMPKPRVLNNRFKKVLPNHQLYDMRTTFETRCDQCKIEDKAIGLMMGNKIGKNNNADGNKLKKAYTDKNDPDYFKNLLEYLYLEGQKFKY